MVSWQYRCGDAIGLRRAARRRSVSAAEREAVRVYVKRETTAPDEVAVGFIQSSHRENKLLVYRMGLVGTTRRDPARRGKTELNRAQREEGPFSALSSGCQVVGV